MWLMDTKTEFWRTVRMSERKTFSNHTGNYVSSLETAIRYLGGYLSAYTFSSEKLLLTLADDIGMQFLPAFKKMNGLPAGNVMAVTCVCSLLLSLLSLPCPSSVFHLPF
ncbi:hypothetical protein BKA70DRAFT_748113 [Coprinopsis sp. MPI-PUGE-AT-0042]|nr:hypothetical protein BKA70DRAFT_748113 [Coprinopsis sp. MPI-PUGE-AT-0042]